MVFRFLGCITSRLLSVPYTDLFATHTKRVPKWFLFLATKMDLEKQEINSKSRQKEDACGARESGAPTLATGLLLTAFSVDFSRFEVHYSCSVWVLIRDSISGHL